MCFSRLKKRRSGQIRAVDFIVSLFLFLLMLSQLIIIVINVQYGISGTIRALTYEELDIFGQQLLLEEGEADWGYLQDLPTTFGLADSNSPMTLTLDAAKIARLVTGTSIPISLVSGFEMYDYNSLKETINLKRGYEFQLGFYPLLKAEIKVSASDIAQVNVTNAYDSPLSNVQVNFFTIDLTNGDVISEGATLTDSSGHTSLQLSDPFQYPGDEHIAFIIVKKGPLWGMNWGYPDPTSENVIIGTSSNNAIWGGGINSSSLMVTDILAVTPDSHFFSIIYQNSTSGYSNQTINLATASEGNEIISIPNEGLVAIFSIARTNNEYEVVITSYPAILDRDQNSGIFYQVFGELTPGERVKSMLSKAYPIVVRGTLMRCQITLWSE